MLLNCGLKGEKNRRNYYNVFRFNTSYCINVFQTGLDYGAMGTVRRGDMVSGLLNGDKKARFYKKFKKFLHLKDYNGVYITI
jgi:hypothetical protein